jgi:phage/plasmid primase-like uncharacterized protein
MLAQLFDLIYHLQKKLHKQQQTLVIIKGVYSIALINRFTLYLVLQTAGSTSLLRPDS